MRPIDSGRYFSHLRGLLCDRTTVGLAFFVQRCTMDAMSVFSAPERRFLHATAGLGYCNPFLPERIEWERAALGPEYLESEPVWSISVADPDADLPNILRIHEKHGRVGSRACSADCRRAPTSARKNSRITKTPSTRSFTSATTGTSSRLTGGGGFYREFLADWNRYLVLPGKQLRNRPGGPARTFSPASTSCSGPSTISSSILSAVRCRRQGCVRRSGNRSSPTTCAATGVRFTRGWEIFRR